MTSSTTTTSVTKTTTVTETSSTETASGDGSIEEDADNDDGSSNKGIFFGVLAAVVALILIGVLLCVRQGNARRRKAEVKWRAAAIVVNVAYDIKEHQPGWF